MYIYNNFPEERGNLTEILENKRIQNFLYENITDFPLLYKTISVEPNIFMRGISQMNHENVFNFGNYIEQGSHVVSNDQGTLYARVSNCETMIHDDNDNDPGVTSCHKIFITHFTDFLYMCSKSK
jgi:hypothetical protein